ncbi:MAG TPA: O-antigen ligase family protein [Panacibacter sp.]|nr:O-antigen ligase family protein [Panacibacter sp.]
MQSIIKHPAIRSFLVYLAATQLNDPLSLSVGGIPVTPVDFAIIYGILINIIYRSPVVSKRLNIFFLFAFVLLIYSIAGFLQKDEVLIYPASLFLNLLWIYFTASSIMNKPLEMVAYKEVFKIIFLLLIPNIFFGFYELVTRKYFFPEGLSGAMANGISPDVFYVRGSFTDKFDFSSYMILGPLMYLSLFANGIKLKLLYRIIALLSLVLVLFSYSSSVIIALVIIILYTFIFQVTIKKSVVLIMVGTAILIAGSIFFSQSFLLSNQLTSYQLKYQRQVEEREDFNFRWIAFNTGIKKFIENPVLGYGMDNGKYIIFNYSKVNLVKPVNSHNYLINNLLDYGLIGFIPITIGIFNLFKFFKGIKKTGSSVKAVGDFIMLLFLFHLITLQTYYQQFDRSMYFVLMFLIFFYTSQKLTYERINSGS